MPESGSACGRQLLLKVVDLPLQAVVLTPQAFVAALQAVVLTPQARAVALAPRPLSAPLFLLRAWLPFLTAISSALVGHTRVMPYCEKLYKCKMRSILGLAARQSAEGRGRVRDRAGELRMDWTEPRGARSAMGIGWSGGRAGALCTGSSVAVVGRRRSVKTVPYVFPRPRSAVGDASRPTRGHQELRRAPGGHRWARHDESRVAGSAPAPTRRSTGYMFPS